MEPAGLKLRVHAKERLPHRSGLSVNFENRIPACIRSWEKKKTLGRLGLPGATAKMAPAKKGRRLLWYRCQEAELPRRPDTSCRCFTSNGSPGWWCQRGTSGGMTSSAKGQQRGGGEQHNHCAISYVSRSLGIRFWYFLKYRHYLHMIYSLIYIYISDITHMS